MAEGNFDIKFGPIEYSDDTVRFMHHFYRQQSKKEIE